MINDHVKMVLVQIFLLILIWKFLSWFIFVKIFYYNPSSLIRLMNFDRKSLIGLKGIMENKRITCVDGAEGE